MVKNIQLGDRTIGPGNPCFLIAEAGVNHNGDPSLAKKLVDAAVEAGVDAVKFQTFKAEKLCIDSAPLASYQKKGQSGKNSQLEMLRHLELPSEVFKELKVYCQQKRIIFLSTPFDEESADFLDELQLPLFKISSGEVTNLTFLKYIAKKGKPVILSTGMSSIEEVGQAVQAITDSGCKDLVLLHCVSLYPAQPMDANLKAMQTMASKFRVPIGYSDHTLGIEVGLAAVAMGACVLEKHLTLDRTMSGPDHSCSSELCEFAMLVRGVRKVEQAMGHGSKEPVSGEMETASAARKSLVAICFIQAGRKITPEFLATRRPGTGLSPALIDQIVGRQARVDIPSGALISMDMLI